MLTLFRVLYQMARTRASSARRAASSTPASAGEPSAPTQPPAAKKTRAGRPSATRQDTAIPVVSAATLSASIPPVPAVVPGTVVISSEEYMRLMALSSHQVPVRDDVAAPVSAPQPTTPVMSTPTSDHTAQPSASAPQAGPVISTPPMGTEEVAKRIESFMKLQPPEFDGTSATCTAQRYIQKCEKILTVLGTRDTLGVQCASFRLSGDAET